MTQPSAPSPAPGDSLAPVLAEIEARAAFVASGPLADDALSAGDPSGRRWEARKLAEVDVPWLLSRLRSSVHSPVPSPLADELQRHWRRYEADWNTVQTTDDQSALWTARADADDAKEELWSVLSSNMPTILSALRSSDSLREAAREAANRIDGKAHVLVHDHGLHGAAEDLLELASSLRSAAPKSDELWDTDYRLRPACLEALECLMSEASEEHWYAGWLNDCEYQFWAAVVGDTDPEGWCDEYVETFRTLSQKAGAWLRWDEAAGKPVAVPLAEWRELYAPYAARLRSAAAEGDETERKRLREQALDELTAQAQELDMGYGPPAVGGEETAP